MYIKTMQNGNPLFWAYKIEPFDNAAKETSNSSVVENNDENSFASQVEKRFSTLETQVSDIQKVLQKGEWKI